MLLPIKTFQKYTDFKTFVNLWNDFFEPCDDNAEKLYKLQHKILGGVFSVAE